MMKTRNLYAVLAAIMLVALFASPISADQPQMQAAKVNLEKAQNALNNASADKGGHRARAMELVGQAINAVNNGIEYDRTHFTPRRRHDRTIDEVNAGIAYDRRH